MKRLQKPEKPKIVRCPQCCGDKDVCNTCGQRLTHCECDDSDQNIGPCVTCDGRGIV